MSRQFLLSICISAALVPGSFVYAQVSEAATATLSFSSPHQITYPDSSTYAPTAIVAGDLNGDGKIDLVIADLSASGDHRLVVLLGDGSGGFAAKLLPFSFPAIGQLLLKDLNGDGHLDLIQVYGGASQDPVNPYSGAVNIYLGDGHGNFKQGSTFQLPDGAATAFTGDFNHDGKTDIIVGTADPDSQEVDPYGGDTVFHVLLNRGSATFTDDFFVVEGNESLEAVSDFDGNGKLDLLIQASVSTPGDAAFNVCPGSGTGTFSCPSKPTYIFDSGYFSLLAADLNGDGKSDVIAPLGANGKAGAQPRVATLLAKGNNQFYWYSATTTVGGASNAQLGDLNGDGKQDLTFLSGTSGEELTVLEGEGSGKFGPSKTVYDIGKLAKSGQLIVQMEGLILAPLKTGAKPSIIFGGASINPKGTAYESTYLGVLINETK